MCVYGGGGGNEVANVEYKATVNGKQLTETVSGLTC